LAALAVRHSSLRCHLLMPMPMPIPSGWTENRAG
jgi:hypothetical protein